MSSILVIDPETGDQIAVDEKIVAADPGSFDIVPSQQIAVKPAEIGAVMGEEVTAEMLQAPALTRATGAEIAELSREATAAERHGSTLEQVKGGLEAAADAAFFGVTAVLTGPKTAIGREVERERREVQSTARLIGGIGGAVIPGLLSGGTGVLGAAARLTPAGQVARLTTKLVSRGGIGRAAAGAAAEGAMGAVGDYISRTTLDENPDFSAQALMSSAIKGGTLGGTLGGLGHLAGKAAGRVSRALDEPAVDFAGQASDVARARVGLGLVKRAPTKRTSYKRLVRKKLADTSADSARSLGARIDDMVGKGVARELDDIAARIPTELAGEASGAMTRARAVAQEYDTAAGEASTWFSRYSDDVQLDKAKAKLTRDVSDKVEDAGIEALERLDRAAHMFDRHADEVSAIGGVTRPAMVAGAATEPAAKMNRSLGDRLGQLAGGAEIASSLGLDTGLPSVRQIPVIGDMLSMYLKGQVALNVARGRGLFPSSRATRAAEKTVSLSDRISSSVKGITAKGLRRAAAAPRLLKLTPTQVAIQAGAVTSTPPTVAQAQAANVTSETTDAVMMASSQTAMRAQQYLADNAPRDPMAIRPAAAGEWEPNPSQVSDWSRRVNALANPVDTLTESLGNPGSQLEVDAIRVVYPAIWAEYREGLSGRQTELVAELPLGALDSIGRNFDLVLTTANVPMYGYSIAARPDGRVPGSDELDARFAAPSGASTSPLVTQEKTQSERRA